MSWWDAKQLASFATQALKTAQKRIDKVLDIKDEETEEGINSADTAEPVQLTQDVPTTGTSNSSEFFDSWLGDDAWSNPVLSPTAKKPVPASSETPFMSAKSDRKTKHLSTKTQKLKTVSVTQESKIEIASSSTDGTENLLVKSERKGFSGLVTSPVSAFDQVKQSEEDPEVGEKPKDHSDDSAKRNPVSALSTEEEILTPRKDPVVEITARSTDLENAITDCPKNLPEISMDIKEEPTGATSVVGAHESRIAVAETSEERDMSSSAFGAESLLDVGWSDVNLNLFNREGDSCMETSLVVEKTEITSAAGDFALQNSTTAVASNKDVGHDLDDVVSCVERNEKITSGGDEMQSENTLEASFIKDDVAAEVQESDVAEIDAVERSCANSIISSASEIDVTLKEGVSMEGSLATSDELSESNKTLTADDLDIMRDDTDVEEAKHDVGEELDSSPSAESVIEECVNFEVGDDTSEVKKEQDIDPVMIEESEASKTEVEVKEVLAELTVNTEGTERLDPSKSDDSPRSVMSGSSYVRNLLEEAMAESSRDSNTDNSHGSEVIRESEYTSGHTSADEIDTTTSSDIEIISHISTPNNNFRPLMVDTKSFDVSPSKANAWSRSMRSVSPHGHRRSDSGSSAQSLHSRNGEDLVSPEGVCHRMGTYDHMGMDDRTLRGHDHALHGRKHHGVDLNKCQMQGSSDQDSSNNPHDPEKLLKKLAEMANILEVREKKQFVLSQENADLMETNNILKNQLKQLEEAREAELEDVKEVSDEFTRRIADSEKKMQMVVREKEALRKTLQDMEVGKRSENVMNEKLLKEKEQTIAELMEEGEKLSKQQLQNSNIIKKLRSKEKDNDTTLRSQKQRIDEQKEEIQRLEGILEIKVDTEKKHVDAINQLNLAMKTQEEEMNRLKSELEDAVEKSRSLKVGLDNAYKEISELHKARVTDMSEAQKVAINVEMQVKEQLKQKLDEHQIRSKQHQEALVTQIEDLQLSLCRMEKEHGRREDILRQEISDLQQRLQEAEERNQELTQSVSAATRPLLRQIENLQTTYSVQSSSYEQVEKNLTDRLADAQSQLAVAVEKERLASDRLMESTAKLTSFETQMSTLRQERSQLQSQLDVERTKVEMMQESKNNDALQRDATIHKLQLEISELKKDKVLLENQLEMEKIKVETERRRVSLVQDQLREKELMIMQMSVSSSTPTKHDAMIDSMSTSSSTPTLCSSTAAQDDLERSSTIFPGSSNRMSIYDSLRLTSTSSLLENLQSQLKQREGEIVQLQSEIGELEKTRESMARQLVNLMLANEDMEKKLSELETIKTNYMELDGRYNALLQMYGEKVEEGEELRMDLQDVKEMYKTQIDELLKAKSVPSGWSY